MAVSEDIVVLDVDAVVASVSTPVEVGASVVDVPSSAVLLPVEVSPAVVVDGSVPVELEPGAVPVDEVPDDVVAPVAGGEVGSVLAVAPVVLESAAASGGGVGQPERSPVSMAKTTAPACL